MPHRWTITTLRTTARRLKPSRITPRRTSALAVALLICSGAAAAVASQTGQPSPDVRMVTVDQTRRGDWPPAVTRPSLDAELGFTISGRVAQVLVREGDPVEAGDPIVLLDDRVAKLERDQLAARAESTAQLEAARAQLELAETDLRRVEQLVEDEVAGPYELERQQLTVRQARANVAIQEEAKRLAELRLQAAQANLAEYTIRAPAPGVVERIEVEPGEPVTALEPIVRLVRTDPLRVNAATPTAQTLALEPGDPAWVGFDVADQLDWRQSVIVSIARVAEAGSETRTVRIETPNADDLPAGARVLVRFDDPQPHDARHRAKPTTSTTDDPRNPR